MKKERKGFEVVCPGCRQSFHITTEYYTPNLFANPSMLRLKEKYKDWGWEDVPQDATAGYGCLECPDCGTPLAPSGHLFVPDFVADEIDTLKTEKIDFKNIKIVKKGLEPRKKKRDIQGSIRIKKVKK